ncbi:ATP phosphoribosyltransferase regulatory subunit [Endothiovibrio diazotrophicus]
MTHFDNDARWLLPEGIEEMLPAQAERMEGLRRQILDMYRLWGYELIQTPLIEYLESLAIGTGGDRDLDTFKLTDQLSGRLMGVRPDITPQAARIDGHHLRREAPVRLCYLGTVLRTRPGGFFRSRAPLQVGAELFGHAGPESDAEVIGLMLETLNATDVAEIFLDLGHVEIFHGLAEQAGLDPDTASRLFEAMQRKARTEVDELLERAGVTGASRSMLGALIELNGGDEVLAEAEALLAAAPASVKAAIDYLKQIAGRVRRDYPEQILHFDLAELRGYHYHTGLVFAAYVPGHGEAVAQGGRYDGVGGVYGHARPATGFSTDLKTLVALGAGGEEEPMDGVFAPAVDDEALEDEIWALRASGERVVRELPGQRGGAAEVGCDRRLALVGERWEVVEVS